MYLTGHEILGIDKLIYRKKEQNHFTLDELILMNANIKDYEHVGFVRLSKGGKTLYRAVYTRKIPEVSL